MEKNKESIEDFGEDDMPCMCEVCAEWFDLTDGMTHPRKEKLVICEKCATEIEEEIEKEEEIEDLKSQLSDAEYEVKSYTEQLIKLGYKFPAPPSSPTATAEEILKRFANNHSYDSWPEMVTDCHDQVIIDYTIEAMTEYASLKEQEAHNRAVQECLKCFDPLFLIDPLDPSNLIRIAEQLKESYYAMGKLKK